MPDQTQSSQLSQNIETQVRTLIGELNMQVIVLRNMLEMAQRDAQQQPRPQQPGPQPIPPQPEQPEPEKPPGTARANGRGLREVLP
jgi:hypothetical protein